MSMGECDMIVCVGYGIPPDRFKFGPYIGSSNNGRTMARWMKQKGIQDPHAIVTQGGRGGGLEGAVIDGIHSFGVKQLEFPVKHPKDCAAKLKEITAEFEAEVAQCKKVAQSGAPAEKKEAEEKLKVIGDGRFGQLASLRTRLERGGDGRYFNFPAVPWDWDGISPFPTYQPSLSRTADRLVRAVPGGYKMGQHGMEANKRHLLFDYGARGPWKEYMDAKIHTLDREAWVKELDNRAKANGKSQSSEKDDD